MSSISKSYAGRSGKFPGANGLEKSPTGVGGFDEITRGGLPRQRATLVTGGPGSGKTVLALQTLVNAAHRGEPGIFIAFEENSQRIRANAASFAWDLDSLSARNLFLLDAQPDAELVCSGNFDLLGLLSVLDAKASAMKAKWIAFDAIDMVLSLLDNSRLERQEVYRVHEWLLNRELTAIITAKTRGGSAGEAQRESLDFLPFMVDCVVALRRRTDHSLTQRSLKLLKYRGSSVAENESPYIIGPQGIEVAASGSLVRNASAGTERVSSGIGPLDNMLGDGYFRGSSVLVTGAPGTAKSTLCGAFAEAACRRGERTLFVSFDSAPDEILRNLSSVKIRLKNPRRRGWLRMMSGHPGDGSAEMHYLRIRSEAREHNARCLVIDPISALAKQGNEATARGVIERLVDWAKAEGITLVCTSLLSGEAPEAESTSIEISTIADTWIHLSYRVHAGERNRALTIIKSRGTAHSNQVRELILSNRGIDLADVYTAGGEVLMGTLRWEKEEALRTEERLRESEARKQIVQLDLYESELLARKRALEQELAIKRADRDALKSEEKRRNEQTHHRRENVRSMRSGGQ